MARAATRPPSLRELAKRVFDAYKKRGREPEHWLIASLHSKLSDDELRQLYLDFLRRLDGDSGGEGEPPPPQKERPREGGDTQR